MNAESAKIEQLRAVALQAAYGDIWNATAAVRAVAPRGTAEERSELAAALRDARRQAVAEHGWRPYAWGSPLWRGVRTS